MLSWLPSSKFHRVRLFTSFISRSIYRSSVGVLLINCFDNIPCCGMEGV